jgi:methionyl-tRNA formyltransferase
VTLQTLDHEHFDRGIILDQTPAPGFEIPNPETCTVPELLDLVSPKGAEILVNGIRNRIFVPPLKEAGWRAAEGGDSIIHAAKVTPEDRHIDWKNWTWDEISRRQRVLGPLWNVALVPSKSLEGGVSFQKKRVIFTDIELAEVQSVRGSEQLALLPGVPFAEGPLPQQPRGEQALYVFARDGQLLRLRELKVEGQQASDGFRAAFKTQMLCDRTIRSGDSEFCMFYNPLM